MTRIEELFQGNFLPGYFTLIDITHPLSLYIGRDDDGRYAIEYEGAFRPSKIKDSTAIAVQHYKKAKDNSIVFSLKDATMLSTFCAFCEDMVESTRCAEKNDKGYSLLVNRFFAWKKMFRHLSDKLDEKRIMGLIGELLFLKDYMFANYNQSLSINSWTGSEKLHKDFSLDDTWYEIKAISYGKDKVSISSFEQLDSEMDGKLVVYHLERMSPEYNGISLNKLVKEIYYEILLEADKDLFLQKLSDADYTFEDDYDDYVYDEKFCDTYNVTEDFPCLHRTPELQAISSVKYELLLSYINTFKAE